MRPPSVGSPSAITRAERDSLLLRKRPDFCRSLYQATLELPGGVPGIGVNWLPVRTPGSVAVTTISVRPMAFVHRTSWACGSPAGSILPVLAETSVTPRGPLASAVTQPRPPGAATARYPLARADDGGGQPSAD